MHPSMKKPETIQVVWAGAWREMKVDSYCYYRKLAIGTIGETQVLAQVDNRAAFDSTCRWVGTIIVEDFIGGRFPV